MTCPYPLDTAPLADTAKALKAVADHANGRLSQVAYWMGNGTQKTDTNGYILVQTDLAWIAGAVWQFAPYDTGSATPVPPSVATIIATTNSNLVAGQIYGKVFNANTGVGLNSYGVTYCLIAWGNR